MARGGQGANGNRSREPVARQGRASVSDVRLWVGVGLLAGSVALGVVVVSRPDDTVLVWRAGHDLGAGAAPAGLEAVAVPAVLADGTYLEATTAPQGRLRWPVAAGTLLPAAALADDAVADLRMVTVAVDPLHAPAGLLPGSVVDVWWTPDDAMTGGAGQALAASPGPELVRAGTVVAGVASDAAGFSAEVAVVLEVPAEEVAAIVRSTRTGHLDLVDAGLGSVVSG